MYEGIANSEDLKLTLQEAFPNIFDEVVTIHLYRNNGNDKFKYVYKIDGFKGGIASSAAVNANKTEFESLTFTSACPYSRPCLGKCATCPCNPETQFGVICGCFDETTGTCDTF